MKLLHIKTFNDSIKTDTIFIKETIDKLHHCATFNENIENSQLLNNSFTIFLALIAGLIALYQVKSNIISSARINWIENLRNAISNYTVEISNCGLILTNFLSESEGKSEEEGKAILKIFYKKYEESANKSGVLANKILLYLNSNESEHLKIEKLIEKLDTHLHKKDISELNIDQIEADVTEIISISKGIFKKEWEKSKKLFKI